MTGASSAAVGGLTMRQLPPLPAAYPNPALTVFLKFDYRR